MQLLSLIAAANTDAARFPDWMRAIGRVVLPHWETALGLVMAFIVASSMLRQRRKQSNIVAWTLLILFWPVIGSLLFLLMGGRKHERSLRTKRAINAVAGGISHENDLSENTAGRQPPPESGNSFELLDDEDGTATWHALCREIDAATTSICVTTYILGKNDIGREFIRRLAARARAGVKVRLLIDAVGSRGAKLLVCRPLIDAGGEVYRFMPVFPFQGRGTVNFRNHRKIAIFDGQRAIIGGQNIAREYMGPESYKKRFRDFSALISGPAVAELTRIFLSDWCFAAGESPAHHAEQLRFEPEPVGAVKMRIVAGGPDEPGDPVWEQFLALFQECRRDLTIVTPYLVPDEVLYRLLLAKLRTGCRVTLIVPKKSDHPFLDLARRPYLRAFHKAGAKILLYEKGLLHGKLFLADNTAGVIGSANLDMRSLFVNFEVATFICSANVVRRLRVLANSLAANASPYEESKLFVDNRKNRLLESLAHLAGPLL